MTKTSNCSYFIQVPTGANRKIHFHKRKTVQYNILLASKPVRGRQRRLYAESIGRKEKESNVPAKWNVRRLNRSHTNTMTGYLYGGAYVWMLKGRWHYLSTRPSNWHHCHQIGRHTRFGSVSIRWCFEPVSLREKGSESGINDQQTINTSLKREIAPQWTLSRQWQ